MLTQSDRPNLQARSWAALEARGDILLSDLPDAELLELIRVANQRRLPAVLMAATPELARRTKATKELARCIGQQAKTGTDEVLARRAADLKARLVRLKEGMIYEEYCPWP